ncbi:hypothetical protein [Halomonas sp. C05BenzN]|uniref:hypothetical protein n=1 Tax=Halomonas sp. C05BenzN TaxID=3411041 RepID=UPI003B95CF42
MSDFRNTRLGVTNAARLMDVRVTELKQAVRTEQPLHGVMPPRPIGHLGKSATEMYFNAGEVMDAAEAIKAARRR